MWSVLLHNSGDMYEGGQQLDVESGDVKGGHRLGDEYIYNSCPDKRRLAGTWGLKDFAIPLHMNSKIDETPFL